MTIINKESRYYELDTTDAIHAEVYFMDDDADVYFLHGIWVPDMPDEIEWHLLPESLLFPYDQLADLETGRNPDAWEYALSVKDGLISREFDLKATSNIAKAKQIVLDLIIGEMRKHDYDDEDIDTLKDAQKE